MDTNKAATDTQLQGIAPSANEPLDPLRRVLVPIEKRMTNGDQIFWTSDKEAYIRCSETGVIRRKSPKINGKEAKKARQRCRQ